MDVAKQVLVLRSAIQYQCRECNGYDTVDVEGCAARACPLWPFRCGAPATEAHLETYRLMPSSWAAMRKRQGRDDWKGGR